MNSFSRLMALVIQTVAVAVFVGALSVPTRASSSEIRFVLGMSALKIPFDRHNNQIYLKIGVNGSKPLWFILDTGARTLLSRSLAQKLGLQIQEDGEVQSTGESVTFKVGSTRNISFELPGATLTSQSVAVVTLDDVEDCVGHSVDGILGIEFFDSAVVEIDYQQRLINIFEAKSHKYLGNGEAVPLERMSHGLVRVRAEIKLEGNTPFEANLVVDTGFAGSLSLNSPVVNKHLPEVRGKEFESCGFGKAKAIRGKVEGLQLGRFRFEKLETIFSQAKSGVNAATDVDGLLGGEILSQYKVIFDYSRRRMILEANH